MVGGEGERIPCVVSCTKDVVTSVRKPAMDASLLWLGIEALDIGSGRCPHPVVMNKVTWDRVVRQILSNEITQHKRRIYS